MVAKNPGEAEPRPTEDVVGESCVSEPDVMRGDGPARRDEDVMGAPVVSEPDVMRDGGPTEREEDVMGEPGVTDSDADVMETGRPEADEARRDAST